MIRKIATPARMIMIDTAAVVDRPRKTESPSRRLPTMLVRAGVEAFGSVGSVGAVSVSETVSVTGDLTLGTGHGCSSVGWSLRIRLSGAFDRVDRSDQPGPTRTRGAGRAETEEMFT